MTLSPIHLRNRKAINACQQSPQAGMGSRPRRLGLETSRDASKVSSRSRLEIFVIVSVSSRSCDLRSRISSRSRPLRSRAHVLLSSFPAFAFWHIPPKHKGSSSASTTDDQLTSLIYFVNDSEFAYGSSRANQSLELASPNMMTTIPGRDPVGPPSPQV
jgi:hypothetical protein